MIILELGSDRGGDTLLTNQLSAEGSTPMAPPLVLIAVYKNEKKKESLIYEVLEGSISYLF